MTCAQSKLPQLVATYDYRDERDELMYQVVRYDPKDFKARRPLDGQWAWNLDGVSRIPYRLPDLIARSEQPVLIVEGEKDADALSKLGYVATCNSGGAGKWPVEFGRYFRGRRCCVIPDNDASGQAHAALVAGSLMMYGVASVRILQLSGVPDKGDVSDWLSTFPTTFTREQIRKALDPLLRSAVEFRLQSVERNQAA